MTNFNKLALKSILSESQFYTVEKIVGNQVQLKNTSGEDIVVDKNYVEKCLQSADQFDTEEKKTKTELAEILINNPRVALTVAFYKQNSEKTKKVFEAEKLAKIEEITNAKVSDVSRLLNELIENPITKVITGELRVMKGRHYGNLDDLGRVQFIDMEITSGHQERQVDTRSILYLIVNNVKYNLSK